MKREIIEKNPVLKLSFDFSLMVIDYCEQLDFKKRFVVSKQLLRSGTSIGANAFEAQNSESKADFIHKMKIAAKESDETQYWLLLCNYANDYPDCSLLLQKQEELNKVLTKIISTSKRNNPLSYFFSFFSI
ncbi:four helix bundle protein [Niabella ginsengisoli]|uniref:Four helix bundle protein n=1 Tax=Niabella ginsengisoli TaxID=522298 RepID=A0ABS9SLU9_9BACT|nr:four helix bundle protein [Niabella ginsengisoli]MCH5599369.1 four helix bundle protein [Niabella ginsengisoli]